MNGQRFGVMMDCSRNGVMTVKQLKRFIDVIAKMGYNCLELYTEDTYEVDGEPYFGYMRGRYTKAEMKELDAYGESLGIEVIPCMQTLAHIKEFLPLRALGESPAPSDTRSPPMKFSKRAIISPSTSPPSRRLAE